MLTRVGCTGTLVRMQQEREWPAYPGNVKMSTIHRDIVNRTERAKSYGVISATEHYWHYLILRKDLH